MVEIALYVLNMVSTIYSWARLHGHHGILLLIPLHIPSRTYNHGSSVAEYTLSTRK